MSATADGQEQERRYDIDVPSLRADAALKSLARQAETQLLFSYDVTSNVRTNPVTGRYTLNVALERMLQGTGLSSTLTRSGVITVTRASTTIIQGADGQMISKSKSIFGGIAAFLGFGLAIHEVRAAESSDQLEEVVVTAQKRAEDAQRVPISMTVVNAQQLLDRNAYDTSQLTTLAPSLQLQGVNNAAGANNFAIRGVGTTSYAPSIEASVSTVVDGVAMGKPEMGISQLFDIDHIEVLNGPQGMLFGKNASAGLINIVSKQPILNETSGMVHASYGNFNEGTVQAVVNAPFGSTSALRVAAFFNNRDAGVSYTRRQDNSSLGLREAGVRVKYLWAPTDSFELRVAGDYTHENGAGPGSFTYSYAAPGGVIATQNAVDGVVASPTNTKLGSDAPVFANFNLGGAQVQASWKVGDYDLTNLAAGRSFTQQSGNDVDITSLNIFNQNTQGIDDKQFSNELRLTSPAGSKLEFVTGIYYFWSRYINDLQQSAALQSALPPGIIGVVGTVTQFRSTSDSEAAFGNATYHLSDAFRLIAGARVTHDRVEASSESATGPSLNPLYPNGGGTQSTTETNLSYKVGAEYDVTPDVMGYVTYSRGYKGPGFNQFFRDAGVIKPEIPSDVEVGVKTRLADRSVTLNVALFHTDFSGFQAQTFDVARNAFRVANAGSLRSQGAEVSLDAKPRALPGLSLSTGIAYLDAIYVRFPGNPCYITQTAAQGCDPVTNTADASGHQLADAPKWSVNANVRWEHAVSDSVRGFISGDAYYRSAVNFTPTGDPRTVQDVYTQLGASVGITGNNGRWKLSLYGRNLTDVRVRTYILGSPLSGLLGDSAKGGDYAQIFGNDSFRTYGIAFDLKLGAN